MKEEKTHMRENNSYKPKKDNNENINLFPSNNNLIGYFPQGSYSDPINSKYQNDVKMDLSQLNNLKCLFSKDSFSKAINNLSNFFRKQNLCVQLVICVVFFVMICYVIYLLLPEN